MSLRALSDFTRVAKYAKYLPEKKRRETWAEQVDRVFDMHKNKYTQEIESNPELLEYIEFARTMMMRKKILGSQRALQFGGKAILDKQLRLYNCSASYIDRPRVFQEIMYILLCGCGAGYSVQKHHVDKLPPIRKVSTKEESKVVQIPDSIEGWADSVGVLMNSYFDGTARPTFDYTLIRPKGSPLSSGSKAPGPDGLKDALDNIRKLLDNALGEHETHKLKPIEAHDIIMHISGAILSGGIRRCLPFDYLVKCEDGNKRICDVKIGDKVIVGESSYPVTNLYDNGIQELMKINTPTGFHVSTPDHRWLVYDKFMDETYFIPAKDIIPSRHCFVKNI
jgi:ribonucleoside-triphosphate reductase